MYIARLENQSYTISLPAATATPLYYSTLSLITSTTTSYVTTNTAAPYNKFTFVQQGTFLVNAGQSWTAAGNTNLFHLYLQVTSDKASTSRIIAAHTVQNSVNNTGLKVTTISMVYRFYPGDVLQILGRATTATTTVAPAVNSATGAAYPFFSLALCLP